MAFLPKSKGFSLRTEKTTLPKKAILIVTEDTKNEIVYFNWLRQKFRLSSVNIKTIGSGADPLTVAKRSIKEYKENEIYNAVYCIIDRDKHPRDKFIKLKDILFNAQHKKIFRIIPSYPCFEYWFILHFANDVTPYTQPIVGKGSIGSVCKGKFKLQYYSGYDEDSPEGLKTFFNANFTDIKRMDAITRAIKIFNNITANSSINPSTLAFFPAIEIELMTRYPLEGISAELISQEKYEHYIKEFFDIFTQQKNL